MKRHPLHPLFFVGLLTALLVGSQAHAGSYGAKNAAEKSAHQASMSEYLVESPHTAEGCLQALDDISAMGPKSLVKWEFGCMAGEHVGWAIVNASDEQAALQFVPPSLRAQARVHKLNRFTAAQVRAFHEKSK